MQPEYREVNDTSKSHTHIFSYYRKGRDPQEWRVLADEAATRIPTPELTVELRLMIYVMADAGDLVGCASVLDYMATKHIPFPDLPLCEHLLSQATRLNDTRFAVWLLSTLVASNSATSDMYSKVAALQYHAKDFLGCTKTYSAMRASGHSLSLNDLRTQMTSYAHLGDVQGFSDAATNLKDQQNNLFTLSSLKLVGFLSDRAQCSQLLGHAEALLRPDHRFYVTLLHMAARTDSHEKFYEVLTEMKSAGIPPNPSVFTSLRASLERTGSANPENLARMAEAAQSHGLKLDLPRTASAQPLSPPNNSLVTLKPPTDANNEPVSYAKILEQCSPPQARAPAPTSDDIREALVVMESSGVRDGLDGLTRRGTVGLATFNTLLEGLSNKERSRECKELMQEMSERGVKPDTTSYNAVLFSSRNPRIDDYRRLMEEMKDRGVAMNGRTYNGFLNLLGRRRHWMEYDRVLAELRASGIPVGASTFNIILNYAGHRGDLASCQEAVAGLTKLGTTLGQSAYTSLITAACAQHDTTQAMQYLADMKAGRITPEVGAYNRVMQSWATKGKGKECGRLLEDMKQQGVNPNSESYSIVLGALLNQPGQGDRDMISVTWEMYNWILEDMQEQKITPGESVFMPMADYLAKMGDRALFNQLCDRMQSYQLSPDTQMYTLLVARLAGLGEFDQACTATTEMRTRGLKPTGLLYASVLRLLMDTGKWDKAECLVKEMHEVGEKEELTTLCERILDVGKQGDSADRNNMLTLLQSKNKTVL